MSVQSVDHNHVSAPRLLADIPVSGSNDARALGDQRPTAYIDPFNSRPGAVAWPRACSTPQAIHSPRHAPAGACLLSSLCRSSDFAHDWNLFVDPPAARPTPSPLQPPPPTPPTPFNL